MKATIFGSTGLLGSEIKNASPTHELDCPTSREVNLEKTSQLLSLSYNDVWINAAGLVGGVKANTDKVGDFYSKNSKIGNHVIDAARSLGVKKLVSILSTCVYPDAAYVEYPITEDQLHNGPPHPSNFGYAYAKRMMDVQSRAYRQQWGCDFITVVPNNLYGPLDNYDLESGHVIPSLVRKFFEAKRDGTDVVLWGDGSPLREFTFARDAAKAIWWLARNYSGAEPVNIGNTGEISIGDLASLIGKIIGFKGNIKLDVAKPNGQHRKPSSNAKLLGLGYEPNYTSIEEGLSETIEHFCRHYPHVRGVSQVR